MNNWPEMMVKRVAASYCGLSVETFEREIAAGRLPMGVHFGGRYRWRKAAIDKALDRISGDAEPAESDFMRKLRQRYA